MNYKIATCTPIQLDESPLIIGAQMCTWGQTERLEIPSLRKRLPAFQERTWNTRKRISFEQFLTHLEQTDKRLSVLIDDENIQLNSRFKGIKNTICERLINKEFLMR